MDTQPLHPQKLTNLRNQKAGTAPPNRRRPHGAFHSASSQPPAAAAAHNAPRPGASLSAPFCGEPARVLRFRGALGHAGEADHAAGVERFGWVQEAWRRN